MLWFKEMGKEGGGRGGGRRRRTEDGGKGGGREEREKGKGIVIQKEVTDLHLSAQV